MNNILSEKEYQKFIMDRLKDNGYEVWPAAVYDRLYAVDRQELFRFLNATQPDTMKALYKIYKTETEETIVNLINTEETKARGSRLNVLKHGVVNFLKSLINSFIRENSEDSTEWYELRSSLSEYIQEYATTGIPNYAKIFELYDKVLQLQYNGLEISDLFN